MTDLEVAEDRMKMLAEALGRVLIHVGMLDPNLGGRGGMTGPELLCAADTFCQSPSPWKPVDSVQEPS